MATVPEQAPSASAPSMEDRIANLFTGDQPALEGDDGDASASQESEETEIGEADAGEQANDEAQEPAQSDALAEIELEGRMYQVPKELKDGYLRQSDYTGKTQDLAALKKNVEAQKAFIETQAQWNHVSAEAQGAIRILDNQIGQYKTLDWSILSTDDKVLYGRQLDGLKERRQEAIEQLRGAYAQFQGKTAEARNKMLQTSEEFLVRNVPKWTKEKAKELSDYVQAQGLTEADMNVFDNPQIIKLAWKAQQYDALVQRRNATLKKAEGVPPVLKPGAANPLKQAQAERMNLRKALGSASDSQHKAEIIRARLEKMIR